MKRTIHIVLAALLTVSALAQRSKKSLERIATADFEAEDYGRAWTGYRALLGKDPNHKKAGVNAAHSAIRLNYPKDSLRLLSSNLSSNPLPDALYFRAWLAHQDKNFDESLKLV